MAPPQSRFALGALGAAAVAAMLQGCGTEAMAAQVTNFKESLCKTACETLAKNAQEKYDALAIDKCKELREFAHEHVMNKAKSDALEEKCLNNAGASMNDEVDAQQANYTQQCIDTLSNDGGGMSGLKDKIQELLSNSGWEGDLDSTLDANLADNIEELKGEVPKVEGESSEDAGEEEGEEEGEGRLRLFASGAHIPGTATTGYAALSCLLGGALAATVGLAVMMRRRAAGSLREPGHESLVDTEAAEESENAEI